MDMEVLLRHSLFSYLKNTTTIYYCCLEHRVTNKYAGYHGIFRFYLRKTSTTNGLYFSVFQNYLLKMPENMYLTLS